MLSIENKIWWRSISRFFENFQVSNSWLLYYIRLHYIINWKVFKLMATSEFLRSPSSKVWGMFVHVVNDLLFMLAPCMYLFLVFCCLTRKMHYKQCFNALVETIVNIFFVCASCLHDFSKIGLYWLLRRSKISFCFNKTVFSYRWVYSQNLLEVISSLRCNHEIYKTTEYDCVHSA